MRSAYEFTILILFRGDSIRRIYNLIAIVTYLQKFPSIRIYVREADYINHNLTRCILPDRIVYEFVFDPDSILHKTHHFNEMLNKVDTPFVGIWDTDVLPYETSCQECFSILLNRQASIALPYNGVCLDSSEVIADLYLKNFQFDILDQCQHLMRRLQPHRLTGGAVLMNREDFLRLGAENEKYYGWGDDDFDRYIRFMNAGHSIFRSNTPLFHLSHPRGANSRFCSSIYAQNSKYELAKTINQI